MENESLGKVLPQILLPYAQQWAERSGSTLLSRLLVDEQFRELIEKYAGDMLTSISDGTTPNGNGRSKPHRAKASAHETDADADDLAKLHDRVVSLEAQQAMQEALFEGLRIKIRPLALALGCCPDCMVGVAGCPKCGGASNVGHYPPDYALLEALVVSPLAARGVPLCLEEKKVSGRGRPHKATTTTRKEKKP